MRDHTCTRTHIKGRGFFFMNSPGNDLESIAGQVASGCNVIYFTTGNGSITNFPIVPTIKVVSTSKRYALMRHDMDVDAGEFATAHAGRDARLRAYAREYRCTVDPTDFAGVVRDAEPVPVPDDHAHPARRFSEAVDHARRECTGADATPQDEDGDVVDVTQAAAGGARGHGAVNSKCPLTMKDVFDLEDPTADVKGYVYERAAIVEYVRRQAGHGAYAAAQCPAAGTNHAVRVAELRPAREVIRAKKRAEAARRVGMRGEDEDDEHLLSP